MKETEVGLIPDEWELAELLDKVNITMGQSPKSEFYNNIGEGVPFMQGRKTFGDKYHTIDTWCTEVKKVAKQGDVLMSVRAPVGDVNIANMDLCIGRGLAGLSMKNNNNEYLYYLLKNYVDNITNRETGTVFASINKKGIETLKLPFAPLKEQESIANILSTLDEKIETNNKINKNLEETAQAIFKHWFVDFEFPDENGNPYRSNGGEMVESELGMIPKGWVVKSLDDIANYLNGLAMQKFRPLNNEKSYPVLKIKELRQGHVDNNSDRCSIKIDEKYIVDNGDIIFSWSGSLIVDIWCGGKSGLNQHLFKVTSDIYDKWFYYLWTKYHLQNFIQISESKATTMGHIKRKDLNEARVLCPDSNRYKYLNSKLNSIYEKIINTKIESKKLEVIRDTLLPKLMSGEIRVPLK